MIMTKKKMTQIQRQRHRQDKYTEKEKKNKVQKRPYMCHIFKKQTYDILSAPSPEKE